MSKKKNPFIKENIQYDSTYILFKNRQKLSLMFGNQVTDHHSGKEGRKQKVAAFTERVANFLGVPTLWKLHRAVRYGVGPAWKLGVRPSNRSAPLDPWAASSLFPDEGEIQVHRF